MYIIGKQWWWTCVWCDVTIYTKRRPASSCPENVKWFLLAFSSNIHLRFFVSYRRNGPVKQHATQLSSIYLEKFIFLLFSLSLLLMKGITKTDYTFTRHYSVDNSGTESKQRRPGGGNHLVIFPKLDSTDVALWCIKMIKIKRRRRIGWWTDVSQSAAAAPPLNIIYIS